MIRADLGAATRRMYLAMAVLGVLGAAVAGALFGLPAAVGFGAGASFSTVNFWFWHRLVARLGAGGEDARSGSVVLFGMRYAVFALGLYVILQYFEASLAAALAGIFVAVAAVLLEVLLELIYGAS